MTYPHAETRSIPASSSHPRTPPRKKQRSCRALQKPLERHLHLETSARSSATSLLEFPALALDIWLLVLVWAHAEMLHGLSGVLWSAEEKDVGAGWVTEGELIEGKAFTASLLNSGASGGCES